jgi:hypothetical protein
VRGSSSRAKRTVAALRVSFSSRSRLISAFSWLISACSAVVLPGRAAAFDVGPHQPLAGHCAGYLLAGTGFDVAAVRVVSTNRDIEASASARAAATAALPRTDAVPEVDERMLTTPPSASIDCPPVRPFRQVHSVNPPPCRPAQPSPVGVGFQKTVAL